MSFNNNDNKPLIIPLDNYEEYLLLYVDGELSAEEKAAVDAFLLHHPQVAEELEILMSTKLTDDVLPFEGKESLYASSMKLNGEEENLLLYLDDELKGREKEALEKKLDTNPEVQTQYNLLLKTKLDKREEIVYPYKKELYRGRKMERPLYWLRIAAAVVIIAGMGTVAYFNTDNTQVTNLAGLEKPKEIKKDTIIPSIKKDAVPLELPIENIAATYNAKPVANEGIAKLNTKKEPVKSEYKKEIRNIAPKEEKQQIALVENKKELEQIHKPEETIATATKNTQTENNFKTGVTTATTAAYNPVEASDNEIIDALATSENKKGRAIRGFLRKATRFIERTTNIDPVNEDDKLLIGAVALKLK